jgi:glycosyltransferase involved in cell wall biosynthesis
MKKTLFWFTNIPFSEQSITSSGSWMSSMGQAILEEGDFRLACISQAKVKSVERRDCGAITQWLVPYESLSRNGLPSQKTINFIQQAVKNLRPDIIHVWGTENYWGLLTARGLLPGPAILDMQGIKYAYANVFYGGLSLTERVRCIGPLEIIRPASSLFFKKRAFEKWGKFEKEILSKHKYISVQSDWVNAHVTSVNPECTIFKTGVLLREEFVEASPWLPPISKDTSAPQVFTYSAGSTAYKGLHVLLRAIAILKEKYPGIKLNIGGSQIRLGIRKSGYSRWLLGEARRLGIEKNIHWIGPLDVYGIIKQFRMASAVVIPSFVETYCLALAETMTVGVPSVVSYAGALPELARHEESALFFPTGDHTMCAWQLDRLLSDPSLVCRLSHNARQIALQRNNKTSVLKRQLEIYESVLS